MEADKAITKPAPGWSASAGKFFTTYGRTIFPFLLAIILVIIGEIFSPGFASPSHVLNLLKTSSFLGIIVLAQTIVIVAGREGIDLSVGALASYGAVFAATVINGKDANIPLALVLVTAGGFLLGLINGLGISYFRIPPLIMTLGMASVINGLIIIYSQGFAFSGSASELLKIIGGKGTYGIPNMAVVWVIVTVIALFVLSRTKYGVGLYGVGANDLTAELNGVNTKRVRALAYACSGAISSLAGIFLLGYIGLAFIDIGSSYVLPSVAAAVIGGISLAGGAGSYLGAAGGSLVLTTLTAVLVTLRMGEAGKQVVYGLVLIMLLAFYGRQRRK